MAKGCYLIHFEKPIDKPVKWQYGDQQHYIGFATDIALRIQNHFDGTGSAVTKRAKKLGIKMFIARIWEEPIHETELAKQGLSKFCEYCKSSEKSNAL